MNKRNNNHHFNKACRTAIPRTGHEHPRKDIQFLAADSVQQTNQRGAIIVYSQIQRAIRNPSELPTSPVHVRLLHFEFEHIGDSRVGLQENKVCFQPPASFQSGNEITFSSNK